MTVLYAFSLAADCLIPAFLPALRLQKMRDSMRPLVPLHADTFVGKVWTIAADTRCQ